MTDQDRPTAMDIGELRRRIREADQQGKRQEQADLLRQLCAAEVNDLRSRQRLGLLLKDLGYEFEYADARDGIRDTVKWFYQEGWM